MSSKAPEFSALGSKLTQKTESAGDAQQASVSRLYKGAEVAEKQSRKTAEKCNVQVVLRARYVLFPRKKSKRK